MKKYTKTALISLLCLIVSACSNVPTADEVPTPAIVPALTDRAITAENAARLAEITCLAADDTGPVAALAFTPDMQTLLVAYGREGKLRHWQLADSILLRTLDASPIGLGGAAFDLEGRLLATSAGAEWKTHKFDDEYLGWQVWDVQTGSIVKQLNKTYDSTLTRSLYPDILLSPDGHWVLMINTSADRILESFAGLSMYGLVTEQTGDGYVNFDRKPEEDDFDVIAFDAQGEFFAAADESGKVVVFPFRPPEYPKKAQAIIEKPGSLGLRPLALAFDSRRHWLAGIKGTDLIIWDLQSPRYERKLEASVGDTVGLTASLAFDPSGNLLGVGSANGWQIWNVEDKQLVAQGTDFEVYSVMFSSDGRLFAWGDANGVVHLWGIPNN
jgi:WD40 repeat protein